MRYKLLLIAAVFIASPLLAYSGKLLGFWYLPGQFDIVAHLSISFGLALAIGGFLKNASVLPIYLSIVVPIMLIGGSWELGQFLFGKSTWFISNSDTIKDLANDGIGAIIGALIFRK